MVYSVEVKVMLRPAILDVQGKTVENALKSLGYSDAGGVRIGKHISLEIEADSEDAARARAEEIAAKVLSNPVMENFEVSVQEAATEAN